MRRTLAIAVLAASVAACDGSPAPEPAPAVHAKQPPPVASSTPRPDVAEPARIRIPSIGVDAKIVRVGLAKDGSMQTPAFGKAGWYTEGPKPGEAGPAVVVAHVDSKSGPDVFAKLRQVRKGAKILVTDKSGRTYEFAAIRQRQTDKTALPAKAIWGATDGPALRLITCGGAFDKASGHYRENLILWANEVKGGKS